MDDRRVPTMLQIQNFVAQLRKKEAPSKPSDLTKYVNKHLNVPEATNQPLNCKRKRGRPPGNRIQRCD
jgi:hypothetical protein